ncbi:hypothetical protein KR067_006759 [Drosophila pandora]|nr:hypothetical protein KR067_006759 [Drosophila pandora]
MDALHAFGLAIGWMDIAGVLFFEALMFFLMRRRRLAEQADKGSAEDPIKSKGRSLPILMSRAKLSNAENDCIFWSYLVMLNVWIVVTLLMITGISLHKPELMIIWLIWCACGLAFDVLFIFWWIYELCMGDAIEALTNIMISLLTMAIEFGFICVIYTIYRDLLNSSDDSENKNAKKSVFSNMMI